jgi:hypothetical protein
MTQQRPGYRFGPLERHGLLGGVGAGQAAVVALAALLAIATLDSAPSIGGVIAATLLIALALVLISAPIAGRTAVEWLPILTSFLLRRPRRAGFRSAAPSRGARARLGGGGRGRDQPEGRQLPPQDPAPDPPPGLAGVRLEQLPYRGRAIGLISERRGRRLTAVLACRVATFALLDVGAQERRLAHWGLVLSGAAGTPVRRIQWVERTVPARGDELARWLHAERDPALPPRGTPIVESYLELIGGAAPLTQEHEVLVAVQVDAGRVRERGAEAPRLALLEQTERLAERLQAAEVQVAGALSPGQIGHALRTAFDPYARAELAALQAADPQREGLAEATSWPLGARESWERYRSDGALHATYWIGSWPRVEVSPMFMDALLGRSSAVRTVAVCFEPIAPQRSTREVESAITRDRADRTLRARFGQSETARQRQASEATLQREAELAAGHCELRLAGFVTVSGRDEEDLRRSCAEVLEQAARARLELHRLYGQQAEAFTFTLPLCRGLR